MNTVHQTSWRAALAMLLVAGIAWFSILDYRKLIRPDEGRYAEIAREMALSGDWVTPRLNGIKYFEKPPLQYWATATAFLWFGENEWTARLWSGLTSFAGILLAAWAGARLFGPAAGFWGALVLASSLWWVLMGHLNTLDMGFAFFLQCSLCGFLVAQTASPGSRVERRAMLVAWACAGLSVLSKGLAGVVLPGMVLVAYCLVQREASPLRRLHLVAGIPLFLAITAPWFVLVQNANPEFARFFFLHEHFQRFLTTTHSREQPAWYYLPILLLALLPWTTMALHASLRGWHSSANGPFHARRFLLLWTLLIVGFFSISGSKLPSYILPVLPAMALLTGDWLSRAEPRLLLRHVIGALVLACLVAAAMAFVSIRADSSSMDTMRLDYLVWLQVAAIVFLAGTLTAVWHLRRQVASRGLASLALFALSAWAIGLCGHETLGRASSAYYIAGEIRPLLRPGVPFYSVGTYEQTLPFYLGRTITLVDYRDEFSFGLDQEPQLAIPGILKFKSIWESEKEAFAMMTPDGFKLLTLYRFPMRVVASDPERVIVSRP